jgi:hypothetical protein
MGSWSARPAGFTEQSAAVTHVFHAEGKDDVGLLVWLCAGVVVHLGIRTHQNDVGLHAAPHTAEMGKVSCTWEGLPRKSGITHQKDLAYQAQKAAGLG